LVDNYVQVLFLLHLLPLPPPPPSPPLHHQAAFFHRRRTKIDAQA
jgi:hypothetical protein